MKFYYSDSDGLEVFAGVRDRESVRRAIGLPFETFPKTEFSENSTDAFDGATIKAWYDAANIVCGVQLYHSSAEFYIQGRQLLGVSIAVAEKAFTELGMVLGVREAE
jgi:hypothetical protein